MPKWIRVIIYCILLIFLLSILSLLLLPTLVSTRWGSKQAIEWINHTITGKIEIRNLELNWNKGQTIEGFLLKDPEGQTILEFDRFTTEGTLWQIIQKNACVGATSIEKLYATVKTDERGQINLEHALSIKTANDNSVLPHTTIFLSDVDLSCNFFSKNHLLTLNVKGLTKQDNLNGSFNIAFSLPGFSDCDWEIIKRKTHAHLNLQESKNAILEAEIVNFPVLLIDKLVSIKNPQLGQFLYSLFGDRLNIFIDKPANQEELTLNLHIDTPLFQSTLSGRIKSEKDEQMLVIDTTGRMPQTETEFTAHFSSLLNRTIDQLAFIEQLKNNLKAELSITNIPITLIPFIKNEPALVDQLNSSLNAKLTIAVDDDKALQAIISLNNKYISFEEAKFHIGEAITLLSPARVMGSLSPDTLALFSKKYGLPTTTLPSLVFTINKFQLPMVNPQAIELQIDLSIPMLEFTKSGIQIKNTFASLTAENSSKFKTTVSSIFTVLEKEGKNIPFLIEPLEFFQTAYWEIDKNKSLIMPDADIRLHNSLTDFYAHVALSSNGQIHLLDEAELNYTLTPSIINSLTTFSNREILFSQESAQLRFSVTPFTFDFTQLTFLNNPIEGKLKLDKLLFKNSSESYLTIKDVDIPLTVDFQKHLIQANAKAYAYTDNVKRQSLLAANLQLWFTPDYYDISHTRMEARVRLTGAPTSVFNLFPGIPELAPVIGEVIDFNIKTFLDPILHQPGYLDANIDSTNFHLKARFKIESSAVLFDPNKAPNFRLTITPESYQYLKKEFNFFDDRELSDPFSITGTLSECNIPIHKDWIKNAAFRLKLSSDNIKWKHSKKDGWHFNSEFSSTNIQNHLHFQFIASGLNTLIIEGAFAKLFHQNNTLRSWNEIDAHFSLEGKQITSSFLRDLFPAISFRETTQFDALFGEAIDLKASCNIQNFSGTINASLKSSQTYFNLDSKISNGILTLNRPLEASIQMTPLFSQTFLAPNIPVLKTVLGAEKPILLSIDPAQFSCPLAPFNLEAVQIGKGSLKLGKVLFKNAGDIHAVLNMVRSLTNPIITLWFTPIYFEMQKGVLSLKRFDILVENSYELANWGSINLAKQRSEFVLGLPRQTLEYAFGIGGLGDNYILQVPFHSENGKIQLDQKRVTARVSSLLAQSHGGPAGKLLGNVVDLVLSDKEEISPSPTTTPFPWQNELSSKGEPSTLDSTHELNSINKEKTQGDESLFDEKKKTNEKTKKQKQSKENLLKGLQEGALQLFDNLLHK